MITVVGVRQKEQKGIRIPAAGPFQQPEVILNLCQQICVKSAMLEMQILLRKTIKSPSVQQSQILLAPNGQMLHMAIECPTNRIPMQHLKSNGTFTTCCWYWSPITGIAASVEMCVLLCTNTNFSRNLDLSRYYKQLRIRYFMPAGKILAPSTTPTPTPTHIHTHTHTHTNITFAGSEFRAKWVHLKESTW